MVQSISGDHSVKIMQNNVESQRYKIVVLLDEFIYANEGKPRVIAHLVYVTQIIMKDYTYH